ncbi:HNH endonuclease [Francisella frigiditurris]|uniref:HNH endonuclease family protein n=1 Tax=Francisella frigiditurris TaxID=1542390 RepID=A0A1J0KRF6_9GAMM|nr:HNH endonuclease [Francisella frigiditurris]APC96344.1 HNH endonuclease family protein [Francisella frigiditurris]
MKIEILDKQYKVEDTKEKITIADSFVVRQNKIGGGNGEAKLYIGNDNKDTRSIFGFEGFELPCFLLKRDLLKYLDDTKAEYINPEQPYISKDLLPKLWEKRKKEVEKLPEKIDFIVTEQTQISGPRVYINSSDRGYKLIRELSLPNITYISVVKLLGENGGLSYYFRLFADYFGNEEHPYIIEKEQRQVNNIKDVQEKRLLTQARIGQGKYREELLKLCPFCPITLVSDDRILIASHIKPWAKSNDFEKTDPLNGFMLTPTFDFLFDRGFLSFTDDKKSILSPFLSNMTYSKLGISDDKIFKHLQVDGREEYLNYHRQQILKR